MGSVESSAANPLVVSGTVNSIPAVAAGTQFYFYTLVDTPGVVAANNFVSFFNPASSTKTMQAFSATVTSWSGGATTVTNSMTVTRISAASAGTLVAGSSVHRFLLTQPDPQVEVRTGNPTTTLFNGPLIGFSPVITTAGSGASAIGNTSVPPGGSFVCAPGQGIVFRTPAGDIDQLWNIQFIWAEL